jgi:hypothetical protein
MGAGVRTTITTTTTTTITATTTTITTTTTPRHHQQHHHHHHQSAACNGAQSMLTLACRPQTAFHPMAVDLEVRELMSVGDAQLASAATPGPQAKQTCRLSVLLL